MKFLNQEEENFITNQANEFTRVSLAFKERTHFLGLDEEGTFKLHSESIDNCLKPIESVPIVNVEFIPDPPYGSPISQYNRKEWEKERKRRSCVSFIPYIFSRNISPLRLPRDIPQNQKILSFKHLNSRSSSNVALIMIPPERLPSSQSNKLIIKLSKFRLVEILVLRGLGISNLDKLHLHSLRICDISQNRIKSRRTLINFLKKSPNIEILNVAGNPLCNTGNYRSLIIANAPRLSTLDNVGINIEERIEAIKEHGNKSLIRQIGAIKWDLVISSIPEIRTMPSWNPLNVRNLIIPGLGLTEIHVGTLPNLQVLDVSKNKIKKLNGSGLERCTKLALLNLSNNKLSNFESLLNIFPYCPSLQHLFIENNEIGNQYRLEIIHACRLLSGSNRLPGIQFIDGNIVNYGEYIESIEKFGNLNKSELESIHWEIAQIHSIGHAQIKKRRYLSSLPMLTFSQMNLSFVQLKIFKSLQVLDLSGNNLNKVLGLEKLQQLQILNLSENPNLNIEYTLSQLSKLRSIVSLSFHKPESRLNIIENVLPRNIEFSTLDGKPLSFNERVDSFHGTNPNEYRFRLAIVLRCFPQQTPSLHPEFIMNLDLNTPRDGYHPSGVCLLDLSNLGLADPIDLSIFSNIETLNLSNNYIRGEELNLPSSIEQLDLSENPITANMVIVLSKLPNLENVALPIDEEQRKELISSLPCVREFDCKLRMINTEITISERCDAWIKSGIPKEKAEEMRFSATLSSRGIEPPFDEIEDINLGYAGLQKVDLSDFSNLKRLILRNNNLEVVPEISHLKKLSILDLRNNNLDSIAAIITSISELPIVNLGIIGNPCWVSKKKFLKEMGVIFLNIKYPLKLLNGEEITPKEIVKAIQSSGHEIDSGEYEFSVNLYRRVPPEIPKEEFEEIDLSNIKLPSSFDLSPFIRLEKLSMSNTYLNDKVFLKINIDKLFNLRELDISNNKISRMETIAEFIDSTPLEHIICYGNPVFLEDTPKLRQELLVTSETCTFPGSTLTRINGVDIDDKELCNSITIKGNEDTKILSLVEFTKQKGNLLILQGYDITDTSPLERFFDVTKLDLSLNKIKILESLPPNIEILDIRNNFFPNIHKIILSLKKYQSLKHIMIQGSSTDTSDPRQYIPVIGQDLRGLVTIDRYKNPFALSKEENEALQDLSELTGYNNPHSLQKINLNGRNIRDFTKIINILSKLPIVHLKMSDNPISSIDHYRFRVIFKVRSLLSLDGIVISMAQRENALILHEKELEEGRDITNIAAGGIGVAGIEQRGDHQIVHTNRTEEIKRMYLPTGTLITKLEILINYFQILSLLVTLIPKEFWPQVFINLSFITIPFNIDLDFLVLILKVDIPVSWQWIKLIFNIILPPLLFAFYHHRFNKDKWIDKYITNWKRTRNYLLIALVLINFLTFALIIGLGGLPISDLQLSMIIVFHSCINFIFLLYYYNARAFRKHYQSESYWFRYNKYKKRFALFFFTIFYLPLVRVLLYNFKCENNKIVTFQQINCPPPLHAIHYLSIFFGAVYIVGIPIFFMSLIKKTVREIDTSFGHALKLQTINDLKQDLKISTSKEDKRRIKNHIIVKSAEFNRYYAVSAKKYKVATSYLYNSYKRKFRYYKAIQMMEKFFIILLSVMYGLGKLIGWFSVIVIGIFTVFAIVSKPFSDNFEDMMDDVSRFANFGNILIGTILTYFSLNDTISGVILLIINCFFLLVTVIVFSSSKKRKKNALKKAKKQIEEEAEEIDDEPKKSSRRSRGIPQQSFADLLLDDVYGDVSTDLSDFSSGGKEVDEIELDEFPSIPQLEKSEEDLSFLFDPEAIRRSSYFGLVAGIGEIRLDEDEINDWN